MVLFWLIAGKETVDSRLACDHELDGNTRTTSVQATSGSKYTYCDLGTLSTVDEFNSTWDIRFQRFRVSTNSGTAGKGSGGSCASGSNDFKGVTTRNVCAIVVDSLVTSSIGSGSGTEDVTWDGSPAMKDWYDYNPANHVLTAKSKVYILRSSDGASFYKLQYTDYYDESGTSGFPTFKWEILNN